MNGQMNACKKSLVENFINRNDPYKTNEPLKFDLRAYASYVKENKLTANQITEDILKKFSKV